MAVQLFHLNTVIFIHCIKLSFCESYLVFQLTLQQDSIFEESSRENKPTFNIRPPEDDKHNKEKQKHERHNKKLNC